jgi:acetylornithine/N-succinyldiaminopimelate aminotransferase
VLPAPWGERVVSEAREAGLLLNSPRPDLLRFMPALTVTDEEIATMAELLDRVLATTDHP